MAQIKIINDSENVYSKDEVIDAFQFVDDYCECGSSADLITWLHDINIKDAVDFVAGAWGIDYEFIE